MCVWAFILSISFDHRPTPMYNTHILHIQHIYIQATARPIRHPAMEEDGQGGKRRRILLDEDEDEEEQSLAAPAAPARPPPPLSPLPSEDSRRARDDEDSDVRGVGYWDGYGLGRSGMDPWVVCFLPSWVVADSLSPAPIALTPPTHPHMSPQMEERVEEEGQVEGGLDTDRDEEVSDEEGEDLMEVCAYVLTYGDLCVWGDSCV